MRKPICVIPECETDQHGRGVCRSHYMKCWRGQMDFPAYEPPAPPTEAERFWEKVDKSGDCWLWTASKYPNGYGQFDGRGAHRASLQLIGIVIPEGFHVDHRCRVLACVNPDHLEPVTASVNIRRGYGPNVASARMQAWSQARTHCKHGHELTDANTYITPREGWRVCRACKAARKRKVASA